MSFFKGIVVAAAMSGVPALATTVQISEDVVFPDNTSFTYTDDVVGIGFAKVVAGEGSVITYEGTVSGNLEFAGPGKHVMAGSESPGNSPGYTPATNLQRSVSSDFSVDIAGTTPMDLDAALALDWDHRFTVVDVTNELMVSHGWRVELNTHAVSENDPTIFSPQPGDRFAITTFGTAKFVTESGKPTTDDPINATYPLITTNAPLADSEWYWDHEWESTSTGPDGELLNGQLVVFVVPEPAVLALAAPFALLLTRRRYA